MSSVEQVAFVIHEEPRIDAPLCGVYTAGEPLARVLRQLMLQVYGLFPTAYRVGAATFGHMDQPEALDETPVVVSDVPEGYLTAVHEDVA